MVRDGKTWLLSCMIIVFAGNAAAQEAVNRARDRGPGVPLSIVGTYIRNGELILYPFFEYYSGSAFSPRSKAARTKWS